MQKNSAKSVDDIIEAMINNKTKTWYTTLLARVLKFYPAEMRADVQPLLCTTNLDGVDVENSPTTNIPIIFPNTKDLYIRFPLAKDDLVLVVYSTVALDEILDSATPVKPKSLRRFSQKDGMVLGGYRFNGGEKTLNSDGESLIIHRRGAGTIIKLDPAGNITVSGANNIDVSCKSVVVKAADSAEVTTKNAKINATTTTIKGSEVSINAKSTQVSGDLTVVGSIKGGKILTAGGKNLDEHTHKYNPGPGAPTETSAPS